MQRFFIVGCPRSGTTLTAQLLGAHPELFGVGNESNFFSIRRAAALGRAPEVAARLRGLQKFFRRHGLPNEAADPGRLPSAERMLALWDALATERGCVGWVEKTPDHLACIDDITAVAPDAKFVHVVRNACNVLASGYVLRGINPSWNPDYARLRSALLGWMVAIEQTRRWQSHPNHLIVEYKHLTQDPKALLTRVCEFLGLRFSEEMLLSRGGSPSGASWYHSTTGETGHPVEIRPEHFSNFNKHFPGMRGRVLRALVWGGDPGLWLRSPVFPRGQMRALRFASGALESWLAPEIQIGPADPA
mgnify:CR=1 FL=1